MSTAKNFAVDDMIVRMEPSIITPMLIRGGNVAPLRTEKPWGYETFIGNVGEAVFKDLLLLRSQSLSRQLHCFKRELYFVGDGTGRLKLGNGSVVHQLTKGHAVYLPAGVVHELETDDGIEIFEVSIGGPANDIIRLDDAGRGRLVNPDFDYGRYLRALCPWVPLLP